MVEPAQLRLHVYARAREIIACEHCHGYTLPNPCRRPAGVTERNRTLPHLTDIDFLPSFAASPRGDDHVCRPGK